MRYKTGIGRISCELFNEETKNCTSLNIRNCKDCKFYKPNPALSTRHRHIMDMRYFKKLEKKREKQHDRIRK